MLMKIIKSRVLRTEFQKKSRVKKKWYDRHEQSNNYVLLNEDMIRIRWNELIRDNTLFTFHGHSLPKHSHKRSYVGINIRKKIYIFKSYNIIF